MLRCYHGSIQRDCRAEWTELHPAMDLLAASRKSEEQGGHTPMRLGEAGRAALPREIVLDRPSASRPLTGPLRKLVHCEYIVREGCIFQLRRSSPKGRGLRLGEMSAQKMAGGEPRTWSAYPRSGCSLVPVQSLWKHRAASELRGQAGICSVRTTQESGVLWLLLRLLAIIQPDWGTEIAKLPCELWQSASSSSAHLRALASVRRAASS